MNIIETLPKNLEVGNKTYSIAVWVSAFNKLVIGYHNVFDKYDRLVSVCVEPENEPLTPDETMGYAINTGIGNAKSLDNAASMIADFIFKHNYNKKTF